MTIIAISDSQKSQWQIETENKMLIFKDYMHQEILIHTTTMMITLGIRVSSTLENSAGTEMSQSDAYIKK